MSEFTYTDLDGDTLEAAKSHPRFVAVITCTDSEADAGFATVGADDARDLAAKLTAWAGEEEPSAPTFKVGDRVQIFNHSDVFDGVTGTVERLGISSTPDGVVIRYDAQQGHYGIGGFPNVSVRPYTPDYAALAASFQPGDLAIVGDKPGTHANGSGWVAREFAGKGVNVVAKDPDDRDAFGPVTDEGPWDEVVHVALGNGHENYIHVAHLTRVEAVKW